ncbi:MAG: hypothetical protein ACO1N9_07605 [Flavobacterium sp.]
MVQAGIELILPMDTDFLLNFSYKSFKRMMPFWAEKIFAVISKNIFLKIETKIILQSSAQIFNWFLQRAFKIKPFIDYFVMKKILSEFD